MNSRCTAFRSSHQAQLALPSSEAQRTRHSTLPGTSPDWDWTALGPRTQHPGPDFQHSQNISETLWSIHGMKSAKQRKSIQSSQGNLEHTWTQLLSVRPGPQTFKPYVVPLTSGVETELVHHVLGQTWEVAVFFIRASPGELVLAEVAAVAEAAGRVWFNCARLWRHIDEEADMNRHSMNTDTVPTVVLRCVVVYQRPAGVGIPAATHWHVKALQVVERLHVVVVGHQAGDVNGAEVTSISLRQSTPRPSAPGKKGHAKVTPEHSWNQGRRQGFGGKMWHWAPSPTTTGTPCSCSSHPSRTQRTQAKLHPSLPFQPSCLVSHRKWQTHCTQGDWSAVA